MQVRCTSPRQALRRRSQAMRPLRQRSQLAGRCKSRHSIPIHPAIASHKLKADLVRQAQGFISQQ